ncbi:MAG: PEP-CTERM sorting domain-containing protein [Bryobacteraceae bacterium]|jgi:hypothetical protein
MSKARYQRIFLGALLSLGTTTALWAGPVLVLTPTGALSGGPGDTVGWGFQITNDANYIEITSASFCLSPVSFPACTLPTTGLFTDFISGWDIIVGYPGGTDPATVEQPFDPIAVTGIGSFAIDPGAAIGAADIGAIVLTYNVFDEDPNDSGANKLATDQVLTADASVEVASPSPEPATFGILGLGLAGLAAVARRGRRGNL